LDNGDCGGVGFFAIHIVDILIQYLVSTAVGHFPCGDNGLFRVIQFRGGAAMHGKQYLSLGFIDGIRKIQGGPSEIISP